MSKRKKPEKYDLNLIKFKADTEAQLNEANKFYDQIGSMFHDMPNLADDLRTADAEVRKQLGLAPAPPKP